MIRKFLIYFCLKFAKLELSGTIVFHKLDELQNSGNVQKHQKVKLPRNTQNDIISIAKIHNICRVKY